MSLEQLPYLGIIVWLLACSLGLPMPEDVPLLTAGFLCQRGYAHLAIMIPTALLGVLSGDVLLFGIGRRFGHHVAELRFVRRLVNPSRLLMAERLFNSHGVKIIFAGRFLPGLRPMIFMAAGVMRVPLWKFVAVNGFAACISVPTLVVLGKAFGHNWDRIKSDVRVATHGIALTIAVVVLIWLGIYLHRRQKRMMAETGVTGKIDAQTLVNMEPERPREAPKDSST